MARVVCQVVHRPGRVTFVWSTGVASFEPYHLEGAALAAWYEAAREGRERLAAAGGEGGDPSIDLALLGHKLYRGLFQLEAPTPAAEAAHNWWKSLQAQDGITSLEIATDRPGCVPWNLVYEQPPDNDTPRSGPKALRYRHFWGFQYALGVGRRVHPLRVFPYLDQPTVLIAVDARLDGRLDGGQHQQLDDFIAAHGAATAHSAEELLGSLRQQTPDVIVILSRVERGRILLGDKAVELADVRQALAASEAGNPNPLCVLLGVGTQELTASWECFVGAATSELSSVVGAELPSQTAVNLRAGLGWLTRFLSAQADAGEALREVRQELGIAGLAFSAFCPPYVQVLEEGAEPDPELPAPTLYELPAQPYRGLAAFDREDRALFSGRDEETARFARLLDDAGTRGVLLHGPVGAGKASFLRAGVLPYLEDEAVGYLVLRDRGDAGQTVAERDYPTLAIRAGADLTGQLAAAFGAFCAQPFTYAAPTGQTVTVDLPAILRQSLATGAAAPSEAIQAHAPPGGTETAMAVGTPPEAGAAAASTVEAAQLWEALNADPEALSRLLTAISARLPQELVLVVEQAEELITQVVSEMECEHRRMALAMLARLASGPARCKVILSLRTEYFGRLCELWPAGKDRAAWRDLFLAPLSTNVLKEALLLPMAAEPPLYAATTPQSAYQLAVAPEVIDKILDDAATLAVQQQVSQAALAQAACAVLVERAQKRGEARVALEQLRDLRSARNARIDQALDKYVDRRLDSLGVARVTRLRLKSLAAGLYQRQTNGTVTRKLKPARDLASHWRGSEPLEQIVEAAAGDSVRFLEVQQLLVGGRLGTYVGLAHDALAAWAARQDTERERHAYARSRIIDALFVLVPLIFLAAALSFFITRLYGTGAAEDDNITAEIKEQALQIYKQTKQVPAQIFNRYQIETQSAAVQLYHGALAQADQVLQVGNTLRARQHLLGAVPTGDESIREAPIERRGFEWHYLWRQANLQRYDLVGHDGLVHAVATSPDSTLAASAGQDGAIRLWSLKRQGEIAAIYKGHVGPVLAVAFAPDGKTIASAGADAVVRLWDVTVGVEEPAMIGQPGKLLAGHAGPVHALAFGKDAATLISAGADKTVIVWDIAAGKAKETLKEHTDSVEAVAFSPDGTRFVTGGADRSLIVWKLDGFKKETASSLPGPIRGLSFAPDGAAVAVVCDEASAGTVLGRLHIRQLGSGTETVAALPCGVGAFGVAWKPKSTIVFVAGKDHNVHACDTATGAEVFTLGGHFGWVRAVAVTPDGTSVITSSFDNTVKVWSAARAADMLAHGSEVLALAFSNDDRWLASGGQDGVVKIWDATSGELAAEIKGERAPITALEFVPGIKEHKLAVGALRETSAGTVRLFEIARALGKVHVKDGPTFEGHAKGVQCLAVAPQTLATGGPDGTVILWETATGKSLQKLECGEAVTSVSFSPSGGRIGTGDKKGVVRGWDAGTGGPITRGGKRAVPIHHGAVRALALLSEEFVFITAGDDHLVRHWAWKSDGGLSVGLSSRAHQQPVTSLARLRDTAFATGSLDRGVKLWDLDDRLAGEERFTLRGHVGPVRTVAASPNHEMLASGGSDGVIRLWRAK